MDVDLRSIYNMYIYIHEPGKTHVSMCLMLFCQKFHQSDTLLTPGNQVADPQVYGNCLLAQSFSKLEPSTYRFLHFISVSPVFQETLRPHFRSLAADLQPWISESTYDTLSGFRCRMWCFWILGSIGAGSSAIG